MTYEQAYSLLKTYWGKDPSQITAAQLQSSYIPLGIKSPISGAIQQAWYAAAREGITVEQRLLDKGFLSAPTDPNASPAPLPTLSGSQFAQQKFEEGVTAVNPAIAPVFETTATPSLPTTNIYRTDREQIVDGVRYDVMSDGSLRRSADQTNIATAAAQPEVDERDRIRAGLGLPPITVPSVSSTPVVEEPVVPTISTTDIFRGAQTPTPVDMSQTPLRVPEVTTQTAAAAPAATGTTAASSVGPAGDSIAQMEYLNRLAAAGALEGRAKEAYNLAVRLATTERETNVRKAEADAYNAALRAVAGLGARGISGRSGLRIAAQRAARSEPLQRKMAALESYLGKTSAASLLLAEENAKAKQAREDAETAQLRANKIASDLAAGATGTATTTMQVPTAVSPLAQSQATQANLNTLPPVIQVPKVNWG